MAEQGYRSPVSKLVRFFEGSRDKWKVKCKQAKRDVKSLKLRLRKLQASRDRWKERARQALASGGPISPRADEPAVKNRAR